MNPPGISMLLADSATEAAAQFREAFPMATVLHALAKVIGSTSGDKIRSVGFDVVPNPSRRLPNHHRLVHPLGAAGFNDANLQKLSLVFTDRELPEA